MPNFKLQLRIHRAAWVLCYILWALSLATAVTLFAWRDWSAVLAFVAQCGSDWLIRRMADHCAWYKHAIGLVSIIEAAKSIPYPEPFPAKHRGINYVLKHKVKKY